MLLLAVIYLTFISLGAVRFAFRIGLARRSPMAGTFS